MFYIRILVIGDSEDITSEAGVAAPQRYSTGATLADIDGDADLDLLVTALDGPNALFINDGTGVFEDQTASRASIQLHRERAWLLPTQMATVI